DREGQKRIVEALVLGAPEPVSAQKLAEVVPGLEAEEARSIVAAPTDEQAREEVWPHYEALMTRIGAERGWPPASRAQFDREAGPDGALCVGSPETVAAKIVKTVRLLGLARFDVKYSSGTLPHGALMRSIELFGTKVAPRVRELLG
ncbi:MAG TPA: hypothetical protein VFD43_11985, partial [Planctomycetota bacterium]|nr:hypothetical protein [Planctomycetota bacterium]